MITNAKHVVFVVPTNGYADDSVVRREVRLARQLGKGTYAVDASQPPNLPFWLSCAEIHDHVGPELIEKLQSPLKSLCAPVMAPLNTQFYVERQNMQALLKNALLQSGGKSSRSACTLWGPAGSGKTRLATRICQDEDIIDSFPDGVLWADADDPLALQKIVEAVTGVAIGTDTMASAKGLMQGRRYLMVVDNVCTPADYGQFNVLSGTCAFLLITRDLSVAGSSGSAVTLGSMQPEEAFELLSDGRWTRSSNQEFPVAGTAVAQKLNYWPQALSLARAALQEELALAGDEEKALLELDDRAELTRGRGIRSTCACPRHCSRK